MTQVLKADTLVKVVIGPVVAVGDGFTPVTTLSLSTADEAELIKHDAAAVTDISGNTFAAITSADGYYNLTITAAQLDTEGMLTVLVNDDSLCLPVKATFMVVNANVYDSLYAAAATDVLDVNTVQVGATVQTAGDIPALVTTVDTVVDGIQTDTAAILVDTSTTLQAELDAIQAATITNAAGADIAADIIAVKADTAAVLVDTADMQPKIGTPAADVSADIAAVKVDTAAILVDTGTTLDGRIPAALVGGRMDADIGAVSTSTTAADKMELSFEAMITGVVGSASTTTAIVLTSTDPAFTVDDQPNGKIITFGEATTTAALRGQSSDITDYDHGTVTLTVTALTTAPVSGDVFVIS